MHRRLSIIFVLAAAGIAQAGDRVEWRRSLADPFAGALRAVGLDGAVYASDGTELHAFTASGARQWTLTSAGGVLDVDETGDGAFVCTGRP